MEYTTEYLPWRGITKSTFQFYDVKTKIDAQGQPVSVLFNYPSNDVKTRAIATKDFYWSKEGNNVEAGLFGRNKFAAGSHKYVTITEGELDALSLYQTLGGSPVVSVRSSTTCLADCIHDRAYLNSFERIYLAFDSDAVGREATRKVAKLFDPRKLYHVKFSNRKDANEYLTAGERDELSNIWWNSKQYLPENISSSFSEFRKVLASPPKLGIPYPFPTLTEMTYGIRTGEVVLLLAQEKVGKTEMMHAIEYKLLQETDDAIGAIFIEEPIQRHLQALAGIHLQKPVHLPDCGVSTSEVIRATEEAIKSDERLHIYSHFGSDDPEAILDTIRFLAAGRSCKYVLFDHISIAVSGNSGKDERRELEYLSTKLEMMVKELDFALIMVSHVNDFGQARGSHWLTKVADITVSATRDLMNADPAIRNQVHLAVPFNRFCSNSGPAGSYMFDPEKRTYTEIAANDNLPHKVAA